MANLNKVLLIGNLTRDPAQRHLPSGQSVTEFGLAINRVYTVNGEKREEVAFVDITAWGPTGDTIHRYVTKGSPIFIEGRLKFDRWETPQGEARSKLSVVCERFQFLGGGKRDNDGQRGRSEDTNFDPADFGVETPHGGGAEVPF